MFKCLGIVTFENDRHEIEGLSRYRTIPAMSFLGRYRIIDIVLSNMVNSGIDHIKILTKNKPRSLIEHIGSGSQYNINSKSGSLQILYSDEQVVNPLYYTDLALLRQYASTIAESKMDYIVIAPSFMIDRINYQEVVAQHVETKADITVVYKNIADADTNFLKCHRLTFEGGQVVDSNLSQGENANAPISLETYIMKTDFFLNCLKEAAKVSELYSLKEFLTAEARNKHMNVRGYEYKGYLSCINSLRKYYETNMELIDYDKVNELFDPEWPIYTKTNDSSPTYYSEDARVTHSLIANGCAIRGTVDHCIIGRGVKIQKGAVVRDSLILPGAEICEGAHIEYAVIDKHAVVKYVKEIVGSKDNLMYVARRDTV
ncbi:MAG: glucose-1-phosphate adenylyltransferase subunit GlgD [Erysipelotrichaceae bacterium]|nr:glucose-1-phosphate adenylyltransferase subunit GlgD [Erysipelotrichaceae bacterium]MBO4537980.1 glucose-1-phosphate adenylyltransferase subunit GlgD [Erysipelotrichaceae bacterium]MBR5049574.1 glucose-1-phosphate adenylyltransferase subunit GlgD [Erysipelotrichaceae bacterium]